MILVSTCFPPFHETVKMLSIWTIAVLAQVPQNAEELLSHIVGILTKKAAL